LKKNVAAAEYHWMAICTALLLQDSKQRYIEFLEDMSQMGRLSSDEDLGIPKNTDTLITDIALALIHQSDGISATK
jgi:hypothetical protein